jgi:Xaa-Pro aminopeptidase
MKSHFKSEFFAANRQRLRKLFTGTAPIVFAANGLLQSSGDTAYPFQQDATFWYLTGIDDPDIILVIDREKEYLIVPGRSATREKFDGAISDTHLTVASGIEDICDEKEGWERLSTRLKKVKHVATIAPSPAYLDFYGMYTNPARAVLSQRMKQDNPDVEFLDLGMHIMVMRMIKQQPEIEALQRAIDITNETLKEATRPKKLLSYGKEYELEAELTRGFRKRGASGHAFEPIVAGGDRACQIHYLDNDHTFSAGELVVLDVGAQFDHYAADVARTVAIGEPSRRAQAVFAAVAEVQAYAFTLIKPGVVPKEYENQVEHFMGEKLRELGLIQSISFESVREFFPHRTSHYLGLNAHDIGDYDRPLEPGIVMTVEPGIYIPAEGIGVRIEDDVLLTESGINIMTDKLPRTLS